MRALTTLAFAAAAVVTVAMVPEGASADRVCKKVCEHGSCTTPPGASRPMIARASASKSAFAMTASVWSTIILGREIRGPGVDVEVGR